MRQVQASEGPVVVLHGRTGPRGNMVVTPGRSRQTPRPGRRPDGVPAVMDLRNEACRLATIRDHETNGPRSWPIRLVRTVRSLFDPFVRPYWYDLEPTPDELALVEAWE